MDTSPYAGTEPTEDLLRRIVWSGRRPSWFAELHGIPILFLIQAIQSGSPAPLLRSDFWRQSYARAVQRLIPIERRLLEHGIVTAVGELPRRSYEGEVIKLAGLHAHNRTLDIVNGIDERTREGLRFLVRDASRQYLRQPSPQIMRDLAEAISSQIGLTPRQARRIYRWLRVQRAAGTPGYLLKPLLRRRIRSALAIRARAIADNSVVEQVAWARHTTWIQAREDGEIPAETRKRSQDQGDSRVRPRHRQQADLRSIPLGQPYELFPHKQHPPFEGWCRCWERLVYPSWFRARVDRRAA